MVYKPNLKSLKKLRLIIMACQCISNYEFTTYIHEKHITNFEFLQFFIKSFPSFHFTDFIKYKSECDPEASAIRLSGILSLHLLSGRGLRTGGRSRRIRDLYCVVEVDHIHKARTVVRSGGVNFDWDEKQEHYNLLL